MAEWKSLRLIFRHVISFDVLLLILKLSVCFENSFVYIWKKKLGFITHELKGHHLPLVASKSDQAA